MKITNLKHHIRIPKLAGAMPPNVSLLIEILVLFTLFSVAICLWLPFGFDISFWADEWLMFQSGGRQFWIDLNAARPLVDLPWHLVYFFSPNSFVGSNVFMLLLIFGKGAIYYVVIRRLLYVRQIAFVAAVLLIVYPADTAIFNLGTLSIHFALFFYVFAVWMLIESWLTSRWYLFLVMLLGLALSVGIYEIIYPLAVVTPFVLLRFERRITKRLIGYATIWYIVPIIAGFRLGYLYSSQQSALSYQSGLFSGIPNLDEVFSAIYQLLMQHFYNGWIGTGDLFGAEYLQYAGISAALVVFVLVVLIQVGPRNAEHQRNYFIWSIVIGFTILLLGFAVYLVTDLRNSTDRTYFYSSLGAALVVSITSWLATKFVTGHKFWFAVVIGLLVSIGMIRSLERHAVYWRMADWQAQILSNLVGKLPHIERSTGIVIFDETPDRSMLQTFTYSSFYLQGAITLIYGDQTLEAAICYTDEPHEWGILHDVCNFTNDRFEFYNDMSYWWKAYNELIVLRYTVDRELIVISDLTDYVEIDGDLYVPTSLYQQEGNLPLRAITMLGMSAENERNSP